jgi:hypothetical protein
MTGNGGAPDRWAGIERPYTQADVERLRVSQARLQVLRRALERSQARLRWLRVFVPGP